MLWDGAPVGPRHIRWHFVPRSESNRRSASGGRAVFRRCAETRSSLYRCHCESGVWGQRPSNRTCVPHVDTVPGTLDESRTQPVSCEQVDPVCRRTQTESPPGRQFQSLGSIVGFSPTGPSGVAFGVVRLHRTCSRARASRDHPIRSTTSIGECMRSDPRILHLCPNGC
jgi:hypothetical protein